MRKPVTRAQRGWGVGIVVVFSGILFAINVPRTGFHGDEAGWIPASLRTAEWVLAADFRPETWVGEGLTTYGNLNPPVGKFMLGLPLLAWQRAFFPVEADGAVYHWNKSIENNIIHGRVPPLPLLYAARSICAVYGVLNCVLIFFLGTWTLRFEIGLVAALLTAANWVYVGLATSAMTDMPYLLAMSGAALALVWLIRATSPRIFLGASALCGVLAAMAYSVKVAGLIQVALLFFAVCALVPRRERLTRKVYAGALLAFGAPAVLVPVLINPFFWPPLTRIDAHALVSELGEVVRGEPAPGAPGGAEIWASLSHFNYRRQAIEAHYPQLCNFLKPLEMPLLFFRWKSLMHSQANPEGEPPPESPREIPGVLQQVGWHLATFPGTALFLLAGLGALIFRLVLHWPQERGSPSVFPLLWFLVNLLFLYLFLILPWPRYYLSCIIASNILVAAGLFIVFGALFRRTRPAVTFFRDALFAEASTERSSTSDG